MDAKYEIFDEKSVNVSISVQDNGIGINREDLDNLFKLYFVSSDAASRKLNQRSNGLGLAIC